jgi:hypothetical protein
MSGASGAVAAPFNQDSNASSLAGAPVGNLDRDIAAPRQIAME